jgi:predicted transcriptional regulator
MSLIITWICLPTNFDEAASRSKASLSRDFLGARVVEIDCDHVAASARQTYHSFHLFLGSANVLISSTGVLDHVVEIVMVVAKTMFYILADARCHRFNDNLPCRPQILKNSNETATD